VKNFKLDNSCNPAPVKMENFTSAAGPVFIQNSDSASRFGKNPRLRSESTPALRLRDHMWSTESLVLFFVSLRHRKHMIAMSTTHPHTRTAMLPTALHAESKVSCDSLQIRIFNQTAQLFLQNRPVVSRLLHWWDFD